MRRELNICVRMVGGWSDKKCMKLEIEQRCYTHSFIFGILISASIKEVAKGGCKGCIVRVSWIRIRLDI